MQLCQVIKPNCIHIDSVSQSKTAVLLKISHLLSQAYPELNAEELFDAYWKRESLGSTAIGQGITIPHIRTTSISSPKGCIIKLQNPVDFGATDKQPVDLVIALVVPQEQINQHLELLNTIIKQFSIPEFRDSCRGMTCSKAFYSLLSENASAIEAM
ncbi:MULTISPECIES: PTS sugar transporter subunit IIA [unclassified Legionella]|uniref:PTS sugar transporter subunit IIA n=1 Tax=unclassified Legionella TaxID=2622702 RepID=UPI0010563E6F|nr:MULTISPECIES: PTS sugar transporter subunit IIA [unclassified Legionella]MDI9819262.1 PTS sugar transporter subunit IIA [Legionella sp. PL877]